MPLDLNEAITKKPTQGFRYRVVSGDRITRLAPAAGVSPQDIVRANPSIWKNVTSLEKLDTIYPGDVLNIPIISPLERPETNIEEFINRSDESAILFMDGHEIPVMAGFFLKIFNSVSDIFDVTFAWEPGADPELDRVSSVFNSNVPSQLYLGGELVLNGVAKHITNNGGKTVYKRVVGYAKTAELTRSFLNRPYSEQNIDLETRCQHLVYPFNTGVIVTDAAKKFVKPLIKDTGGKALQTGFDNLAHLAKEKGVILTNDKWGNLVIDVSKSDGLSIDQLIESESQSNSESFNLSLDQNEIYQNYHAIGQTPKSNKNSAHAKDDTVNLPSLLTFQANANTANDLEDAVNFKRNSAISKALTQDFPVPGWKNREEKLWPHNEFVDVISKIMEIPNGAQLLIKQAKFMIGQRPETILSLMPTWAYSSENINKLLDTSERTPSLIDIVGEN